MITCLDRSAARQQGHILSQRSYSICMATSMNMLNKQVNQQVCNIRAARACCTLKPAGCKAELFIHPLVPANLSATDWSYVPPVGSGNRSISKLLMPVNHQKSNQDQPAKSR